MPWLQYIIFIGIIGIACGNLMCFEMAKIECGLLPGDICRPGNNIVNCVSDSAGKCGLENDEDVKNVISFAQEMCQDGSEANKKYKQYMKCNARMDQNCPTGYNEALQELVVGTVETSAILDETIKIHCRFREEIADCLGKAVKETCGYGALLWHKEHRKSSDILEERTCAELNGAGVNSIRLSMWLLQATFLAFTFKWLSC